MARQFVYELTMRKRDELQKGVSGCQRVLFQ
jgi:hypothetical protein